MNTEIKEILTRVADGNIGALSVMLEAIKANPLLGMAILLHLDRLKLKGPQVWNLSKISGRDPEKMATLLLDEGSEILRTIKATEDLDYPTVKRLAESVGTIL